VLSRDLSYVIVEPCRRTRWAARRSNAQGSRRLFRFGLWLVVFILFVSSCGSAPSRGATGAPIASAAYTTTSDVPSRSAAGVTVVAQAIVNTVQIYAQREGSRPRITLANPQPSGAPLVFVVRAAEHGWLHVLLPVRPNGSSGWIRRIDVRLSQHDYRIVVELRAHRITVFKGSSIVDRESVGVGRAQTPTPGGVYYTKELLRPVDPNGIYGPFAYQLSGFSDVLMRFNGGGGVIGIHGTNEPWLLGRDVSHGCIRMSNAGITRLAHLLPLGVPVEIRP